MVNSRPPKHNDYVKNKVKYTPLTLSPFVPTSKEAPTENETKMNEFYLSEHAAGQPVHPAVNPMWNARSGYKLTEGVKLFNDRRKKGK